MFAINMHMHVHVDSEFPIRAGKIRYSMLCAMFAIFTVNGFV